MIWIQEGIGGWRNPIIELRKNTCAPLLCNSITERLTMTGVDQEAGKLSGTASATRFQTLRTRATRPRHGRIFRL
jgi:hypothetical protein